MNAQRVKDGLQPLAESDFTASEAKIAETTTALSSTEQPAIETSTVSAITNTVNVQPPTPAEDKDDDLDLID